MKRFLIYLVLVPLALLIIVVSVANRHLVMVSLDPVGTQPALSFQAPLFVLLFAAVAVGVVIGGVAVWFRQGRWRKLAREEKHEIVRLQDQARLRPDPTSSAPALPAASGSR